MATATKAKKKPKTKTQMKKKSPQPPKLLPKDIWFKAGQGSRYTDEEAKILGPALAELVKSRQGEMSAADVVYEAESPSSPFHERIYAEDDKTAAFMRREELAREMIRSIYVCWSSNTAGEPVEESTRLLRWVVIQDHDEDEPEEDSVDEIRPGRRSTVDRRTRRLVTIDEVVGNLDYEKQMIDNARADFKRMERRYRWFMENLPKFKQKFRKTFNAIGKL